MWDMRQSICTNPGLSWKIQDDWLLRTLYMCTINTLQHSIKVCTVQCSTTYVCVCCAMLFVLLYTEFEDLYWTEQRARMKQRARDTRKLVGHSILLLHTLLLITGSGNNLSGIASHSAMRISRVCDVNFC